jgi:adenine-specific DNA-methyltransferase
MQLNVQTPRKFLNPLLSQKSVVSTDVEAFKAALGIYVENVQQLTATRQSEPNIVAGALMPFLQAVPLGYNCRPHSQKGQSGIDLAILSGKDVTVIIEAKAVGSKDMITAHDLNKKAFHEAIFYFMQERSRKNDKLAHIVITDFQEWYVFDAKDFERLFWGNSQLNKTFHAYHNPNLLTTSTSEVYAAIAEELPRILKDLFTEEAIDCAYFSLAATHIGKGGLKDKELTAIYKLLSPDSLLKGFNPNDANSLNREFYNELLYILGLNEVKDGGKRLIQASGIAGSLYDGIADKLDQKGAPHAFEDVIKLIIIWINRVLFLKLLESQIVTWTGEKTSRFLSADKISGYDALENLFFDTLARRIPDRKNKGFDYIPYLNSSLFEMQEEEKAGISISALPDGAQIAYYSKTVVKDATTKRKSGQTSTLAYLFEFLDAYDFANDNDDEVREETKSLISASVLGLIFEKINGYKDGSFYTPSFVTMYMARQTIEKAVLQKFNEAYGWTCTALSGDGGLKNQLKDHKVTKKDSNALIDSLKICDPAVGSGHFLVSALNEILHIKSLLGLMVDEAGDVLDYDIVIENDELIVTSDKGELFEYKKGSKEKTLVQKTLFQEKQKIIENCLFGVDINPNSVNICRLRLWIELLKNAYYQPNGELETLPNIDINIKCGNSLISRFALDTDLKDALKKSKVSVEDYRAAVSNYRNTSDKAEKKKIESLIADIKSKFSKDLQANDPNKEKLIKTRSALRMLEGQDTLFEEGEEEQKTKRQRKAKLKDDIAKLETAIEDVKSSKIYKDAFEWRLEFPEVLDEAGNFIGFDVIIGNPPYGANLNAGEKSKLLEIFTNQDYQLDTYMLFMEQAHKIMRFNGEFGFIVPNTWLSNLKFKKIRQFVLNQMYMREIAYYKKAVFDEAVVDTLCVLAQKNTNSNNAIEISIFDSPSSFQLQEVAQDRWRAFQGDTINVLQNSAGIYLQHKLQQDTKPLGDISNISIGMKPYQVGKGNPKQTRATVDNRIFDSSNCVDETFLPLLRGSDIQKYITQWDGKRWIQYGAHLAEPRVSANFQAKEKVVIRQTGDTLIATLDTKKFICMNNMHVITARDDVSALSLKYLLALVNSKVFDYYHFLLNPEKGEALAEVKKENVAKLPVKVIEAKLQKPFIIKVDAILKAKAKGADTSKLEREIDDMVYRLYGLTYDEVKTIEPEYSLSREEYEATA